MKNENNIKEEIINENQKEKEHNIKEIIEENKNLKDEIESIKKENEKLKREIKLLKDENDKLNDVLKKIEDSIKLVKKEVTFNKDQKDILKKDVEKEIYKNNIENKEENQRKEEKKDSTKYEEKKKESNIQENEQKEYHKKNENNNKDNEKEEINNENKDNDKKENEEKKENNYNTDNEKEENEEEEKRNNNENNEKKIDEQNINKIDNTKIQNMKDDLEKNIKNEKIVNDNKEIKKNEDNIINNEKSQVNIKKEDKAKYNIMEGNQKEITLDKDEKETNYQENCKDKKDLSKIEEKEILKEEKNINIENSKENNIVENQNKKEDKMEFSKESEIIEEVKDSKGFNKQVFINQIEGKMEEKYEIIEILGSGGFSRCLKVKNKTTGNFYACKEIQKKKMSDLEGFKYENNILIKLDHPNIIKLYEIYETNDYFYLVMELCSGGELFDRILNNIENGKSFSEEQAAIIFQQMMSAINYCHKNNIVHRDLKPENLLCLDQRPNSPIKVIDFGMSKIIDPNDIMFERVGTAYYIAPEVLEGMYDEKCDIWSAGVILYILLCGYPCFNGETDEQIYKQIKKKRFDFPSPEWDNISEDAKSLIKKMLTDSTERITAEEVLKDPWVLQHAPNAKKGGLIQINEHQLKNYAASSKMRKAVLTFIASRLTQNEIEELNKNFQEIDDNNDGKLTLEEIKQAINKNKDINIEHIEEIFKSIDTDGSGCIEYTEFISASLDQSLYLKKEKLKEAFSLFDLDHNGKISNSEISKVLGMDKGSKEISKIIEKYDTNKDGEIDFDEFYEMMKDLS